MKRWLSGCDEAMRIRMDGGAVGVQIEQQCRSAMLLVTTPNQLYQVIGTRLAPFIEDCKEVATCNWHTSGRSLINDDDFSQEIHAQLQTLGPYFSAESIIQFIDSLERLACLNWKKTISVTMT